MRFFCDLNCLVPGVFQLNGVETGGKKKKDTELGVRQANMG